MSLLGLPDDVLRLLFSQLVYTLEVREAVHTRTVSSRLPLIDIWIQPLTSMARAL